MFNLLLYYYCIIHNTNPHLPFFAGAAGLKSQASSPVHIERLIPTVRWRPWCEAVC